MPEGKRTKDWKQLSARYPAALMLKPGLNLETPGVKIM